MAALLALVMGSYYLGMFVAFLVHPWRAGMNVHAYAVAFAHPPSRRNGVPWVVKTFAKACAWPVVLGVWLRDGRPPARVVFGPEAAERLGQSGTYLPGFQTMWKDPEPWIRPRPVAEPTMGSGRPVRSPMTPDLDLIADFGRHQFLGWEAAGELGPFTDWFGRTEIWHKPLLAGPPTMDNAVAQLNDLASRHGGWVAIGAWKLLLDYCPNADLAVQKGGPALIACVRAYDDFGITNLAIHLPRIEMPAYQAQFGQWAPRDGFLGPPVFSTPDGPQKADYLRSAARAAAARNPRRLPFVAGVAPSGLAALGTNALWDYARLVVMGPDLVPAELRDEGAILAGVRSAANGTDHRLVLQWLRETLEKDENANWDAVGAARFCEEYLHERLTRSPDHVVLLDLGLEFMRRVRLIPGNVSISCLSETEVSRLRMLTSG